MNKKKSNIDNHLNAGEIENFELLSHGFLIDPPEVEDSDEFDKFVTGQGVNELEAFNDAIAIIEADEGIIDTSQIVKKAGRLDEEYYNHPITFDEEEDDEYYGDSNGGDNWYYYTIFYTVTK